jgi:hypothetical protein
MEQAESFAGCYMRLVLQCHKLSDSQLRQLLQHH